MKKFKVCKDLTRKYNGKTLYPIRALRTFNDVKKGDLGGFVESESNLCQHGHCWIYDNAIVMDNAIVEGDAEVRDDAVIKDAAKVCNEAQVFQRGTVSGNAVVGGEAMVSGRGKVSGQAKVNGTANIFADGEVSGHSHMSCGCVTTPVGADEDYVNTDDEDAYDNIDDLMADIVEEVEHEDEPEMRSTISVTRYYDIKIKGTNYCQLSELEVKDLILALQKAIEE